MENNLPQLSEDQIRDIFKDYSIKIGGKLPLMELPEDVSATDINNMVIVLNWCFKLRNNFFSTDFNRKSIFGITQAYKQLKTNILLDHENTKTFFDGILPENLRILKFVINRYLVSFDEINGDGYHDILCERASKDSLQRCLALLTNHMRPAA